MRRQLLQWPQKLASSWPAWGPSAASLAGLEFALERQGEQQGERILAGAAGAEEDERVREAAGGDGGAEALDRGVVADEVVEGGGKRHDFQITLLLVGAARTARASRGGDLECPPPPPCLQYLSL